MDSVLILGTGLTGQSAGRYLKNKIIKRPPLTLLDSKQQSLLDWI